MKLVHAVGPFPREAFAAEVAVVAALAVAPVLGCGESQLLDHHRRAEVENPTILDNEVGCQ